MSRVPLATLALAAACGGADADGTLEGTDPAEEACFHVAEGQTVDGAADPAEAPLLDVGFDPYRVVLVPDAPTYVAFAAGPGSLVLSADTDDAIAAVRTDGEAQELSQLGPNPTCEQDLLTLVEVSVGSGEHVVELSESYKATVWLLGAMR